MKKVVFVNLWRVLNAYGGTERVFFNMANALAERDYSVTLISCDNSKGGAAFLVDPRVNFQNIPVKHNPFWLKLNSFYLPTKRTKRYKRNLLSLGQKAKAIGRVIQTVNPDVIISFQQEATFILKGILKLDVPVITMFHGKPQLFFEEEFFEQYKQSLEDCECCQILMPEYFEELTRFFRPQKVELIPNVVPQYTAGALLQEPTIIHIGRISPEKRQHLIVEAFSLLKDKYPEWNVEIWGETNCAPNYTNRVTQLISDNALTDRIRFCGSTNNIGSSDQEFFSGVF